jgi:hypothetical protein
MCSAVNTDSCYGRTRRRYVSIVAPVGKQAISYRDECERVEVKRRFSLAKRKCGMGLVTAKLRETAAHVIAMSVLVLNLRKIQHALLRVLAYLLEILAQNKNWALVQWTLITKSSLTHF